MSAARTFHVSRIFYGAKTNFRFLDPIDFTNERLTRASTFVLQIAHTVTGIAPRTYTIERPNAVYSCLKARGTHVTEIHRWMPDIRLDFREARTEGKEALFPWSRVCIPHWSSFRVVTVSSSIRTTSSVVVDRIGGMSREKTANRFGCPVQPGFVSRPREIRGNVMQR